MKGIYLAAYKAYHPNYDLDYNDIKKTSEHINIIDDMLNVDLDKYDFIIATPPCNYYSKLNRFRDTAAYSQKTKHLLPDIISKLSKLGKPFIVENVRSHIINKLIQDQKDFNGFIYQHGRHTYWTNIMFNIESVKQITDIKSKYPRAKGHYGWFVKPDGTLTRENGKIKVSDNIQGGINVHNVIEYWLEIIHSLNK